MLKKTLADLQLLLTPDFIYQDIFTNLSIITFRNDRSFKDHLVQALLSMVDTEGRSKLRGGRNVLSTYINQ